VKQCWLDLTTVTGEREAVGLDAVHHGLDAVVVSDPRDLEPVRGTVRRVLRVTGETLPDDLAGVDVVLVDPATFGDVDRLARRWPDQVFGSYVEVSDPASLDAACRSARRDAYTVLRFRDPTNIPLEIVLAAAADATGTIVTVVDDVDVAAVHFGVLEHGPDGVLLTGARPGDAARLRRAADDPSPDLTLTTLEVIGITCVGMGERACVDTCSYLRPDEGILVGSRSRGLMLCASETHPLPYMPTRPFRVNAGAAMSYTLAGPDRTTYLSELRAGARVLAVDVKGHTRPVTVGRIKVESRPLLSIDATAPDGRDVNLIVQNDWHVRLLGPGGAVLNSTDLKAGDNVLAYLPERNRHVGYPIDELCHEQ
jgi:3-amino-4-hydroxybenzoic acid synthase